MFLLLLMVEEKYQILLVVCGFVSVPENRQEHLVKGLFNTKSQMHDTLNTHSNTGTNTELK